MWRRSDRLRFIVEVLSCFSFAEDVLQCRALAERALRSAERPSAVAVCCGMLWRAALRCRNGDAAEGVRLLEKAQGV